MTQYGKQPQESSVPNEVLLLLLTVLHQPFYFSSTSTELQLISRHISSVQPSTSAIWNNCTSITGTLFHDDAVAVYINGHPVKSVDMPTNTQSSNMFYAGVSAGAPKQADLNLSKAEIAELPYRW